VHARKWQPIYVGKFSNCIAQLETEVNRTDGFAVAIGGRVAVEDEGDSLCWQNTRKAVAL